MLVVVEAMFDTNEKLVRCVRRIGNIDWNGFYHDLMKEIHIIDIKGAGGFSSRFPRIRLFSCF